MCKSNDKKQGCLKPENLKSTPDKCSPEQIRKCHGQTKDHPCADKKSQQGTQK